MCSLLTAQIAEQFCDDEDSVDLSRFAEIDSEAATLLGHSFSDLQLNGLTTLEPQVARYLACCEADLSLNGLRHLDAEVAAALAQHAQGRLLCDGLTHLTDDAARMLMRHSGNVSLRGVASLSPKVASLFAFASRKFTLGCSLPVTPSISELSEHWGPIANLDFLTVGWPAGSEMLFAVGAQYHLANVLNVFTLIKQSGSFVPPRAMLLPEPTNTHDPNAVAVVFPTQQFGPLAASHGAGIKVGYLQRNSAAHFRQGCALLGLGDAPVEVLACILAGKGPNEAGSIKVYLPNTFVELIVTGYTSDPCAQLAWLASATPVQKKELTQNRAKDYTLDEQRKIYCRYAQYKGWNCLPDSVEDKVAGWQSRGLGPMGLAWVFHQEGHDPFPSDENDSLTAPEEFTPSTPQVQPGTRTQFPSQTPRTASGYGKDGDSHGSQKIAASSPRPREIDAGKVASGATLKTLFTAWRKWRNDVTAEATRTNSVATLGTVLATGDIAFVDRYRCILEEEFEAAEEKAYEKNSERASARVFLQLLERVRKASDLESWPEVADAFEDFEIKCEAYGQ